MKTPVQWIILPVVCLCWACQPAQPAAPPAAPAPTQTALPTGTTVPLPTPLPSPTRTAKTAATQPAPIATALPLSPTGPWLVFRQVQYHGEGGRLLDLIVFNQDGSGTMLFRIADCHSEEANVPVEAHPANALVTFHWETYLLNPVLGTARGVDQIYPCGSYFPTGERSGLLAEAAATANGGLPELRAYQLPEGRLLGAFPLLRCPGGADGCSPDALTSGSTAWSPSGRSLAYATLLDGGVSGLNIFDVERGETREVARLDGNLRGVWWSPDETRIVASLAEPADASDFVSSLWVISLPGGEARLLAAFDNPYLREIVGWVDKDRFLLCDGSLQHVATEGAYNLRLADLRTGALTDLFLDGFVEADFDPKSETVGMFVMSYNSRYEPGFYLVPMDGSGPRLLERPPEVEQSHFRWNAEAGMFVSEYAHCREKPGQFWGYDPQGQWRCTTVENWARGEPAEQPAEQWTSPDGRWKAVAREGLWLEEQGQQAALAYEGTPREVIWQPDSGGLFFIAEKFLFHLSLSGMEIKDLGPAYQMDYSSTGQIKHQWIGGE